ncbi:MAG: hypothetical protein Harvfovirus42_1 [Harvfovirus sp.]|uniref:Integrase n=1 Tax=Harvfovirus sp. TaxID=2487768 RepID=A0A3G5A5P6_9VIRU|nr:MAG: hypothetical protein Harvfovirus42_1 [Harvfovirus sp.]
MDEDQAFKATRLQRVQKKLNEPLHDSHHTLTPTTIQKYLDYQKKLTNLGVDLDNIHDVEDLYQKIQHIPLVRKSGFISPSSCGDYLNALSYFLKHKEHKTDHDIYVQCYLGVILNDITAVKKLKQAQNNNAGKQAVNYIDWIKVQEVYDLLKANKDANKQCSKNFLLLSLYFLMPVRRRTDYGLMVVVNSEKDAQLSNDFNYYVNTDKGFFIFNQYKTSNTYFQQILIINDDLDKIIKRYINKYKITGSLLKYKSVRSITEALTNIFKSYLVQNIDDSLDDKIKPKRVSINILRHAYISHLTQSGKLDTLHKRNIISKAMAHSVLQQLEYVKDPNKKFTQVDEDRLMKELKNSIINGERISLAGII